MTKSPKLISRISNQESHPIQHQIQSIHANMPTRGAPTNTKNTLRANIHARVFRSIWRVCGSRRVALGWGTLHAIAQTMEGNKADDWALREKCARLSLGGEPRWTPCPCRRHSAPAYLFRSTAEKCYTHALVLACFSGTGPGHWFYQRTRFH